MFERSVPRGAQYSLTNIFYPSPLFFQVFSSAIENHPARNSSRTIFPISSRQLHGLAVKSDKLTGM